TMGAYHIETVCWKSCAYDRSVPIWTPEGLPCPHRSDTRVGRQETPTAENAVRAGPSLDPVCCTGEQALLRAVKAYVKRERRRSANFMIWGTSRTPQLVITTHGCSEKRANRGNGL